MNTKLPQSSYSATYTDIVFNPNDGTRSTVIATVVDPYLADCIADVLNRNNDTTLIAATQWALHQRWL